MSPSTDGTTREGISVHVVPHSIDALTGLRFIAAFTVAFGHSLHGALPAIFGQAIIIGMPLFFTLSGFIIHYVYSEKFNSRGFGDAAFEFAAARFSRIYPLYFILFLYTAITTPMGRELLTARHFPILLSYILAYSSWWPFMVDNRILSEWYYGISWSVSTEIFFYVCYALVLFRIGRVRRVRTCVIALLSFCVFAYLVFAALFYLRDYWEPLCLVLSPEFKDRLDFANSFYRWLLYISPYSQIFSFIGGCLTCQLYLMVRHRSDLCARFRSSLMAWVGIGIALGQLCVFNWLSTDTNWLGTSTLAALYMNLHMNFLMAPACYLLFLAVSLGKSPVSRLLSAAPAVVLGEISYSIYLGHPIAQTSVYIHFHHLSAGCNLVVTLLAIYCCAWLFYCFIEMPAKERLRWCIFAWRTASRGAGRRPVDEAPTQTKASAPLELSLGESQTGS